MLNRATHGGVAILIHESWAFYEIPAIKTDVIEIVGWIFAILPIILHDPLIST